LLYEALLFRSFTHFPHVWRIELDPLPAPRSPAHAGLLPFTREQSLSVRQLEEAIQVDLFTDATTSPLAVPLDQDPFAGQPLRPRFGGLYIYRVVPSHRPDSEHPDV